MSKVGEYYREKEEMKFCSACDGDGYLQMSCCGDDMKLYLPDNDLCPSCNEHQGEPEKEACEECLDGEEWEGKVKELGRERL